MVFNSISFSIRFASPRVALAFEQRHVRFVKIPITCLVVITLYYYVSGKRALLLVYIIIIVYPVRVHLGILYIIISRILVEWFYYRSVEDDDDDYCVRQKPSVGGPSYGLCHRCDRRAVGEGRRENLTLHDWADFSASRFIVVTRNERNEKPDLIVIRFNYFIRERFV
jgi:hypothetical protein